MPRKLMPWSPLPGFGISLGATLLYLSLIVLIPLSTLIFKSAEMSWDELWATVTAPRVVASYKLTFGAAAAAAGVNAVFGTLIAWTLVRRRFPGRRLIDATVDLPFALPTAVSGIALTAILAPGGWIGRHLDRIGVQAAFSPVGVCIALIFVGLPFVVRSVQPALEDMDAEIEEAALSLGARPFALLRRVILPTLAPAMFTGVTLAFARGLGEYGSVIFISGNMPMRTEITSLLIASKLEQYDYAGAAAISVVTLAMSLGALVLLNLTQRIWIRGR